MAFKKEITDLLDNIADLLELKGENPFKIGAYRKGASILRNIEDDIETLIKNGGIKSTKGIGKSLLSIINEFYEKGFSTELNKLTTEIPVGVIEFLKIRGLGASKIRILYSEHGIDNIKSLELSCKENKIALIKGFGQKTQESILKEIERISLTKKLLLLNQAEREVEGINKRLLKLPSIKKIELTGEYRRKLEVISRIEFVILVSDYESFLKDISKDHLKFQSLIDISNFSFLKKLDSNSFNVIELETNVDASCFLYICKDKKQFEKILFITTGSDNFINHFNKESLETSTESEIFSMNNLPFIIPEMREENYFQVKEDLRNNSNLSLKDFNGLLHFHTTFSDGRNSLLDMADAAKNMGFKYLVVCDHSKSAIYANGLSEERILQQKKEVEKISLQLSIPILHGIESDILQDGKLDYDNEFLNNFSFVAASIHSRFGMEENEMNTRIIRAVENEHTDLLGHPTGRLLLSREPYKINVKKIIDACAANQVAIEINAHPQRLDLDWRHVFYAREKGCLLSVNPDAHSIEEILLIGLGISIARKAGVQISEVINCMSLKEFKNFLNRKLKRFG